ncbi:type I restriction-modification system subunit M [Marinobacterium arenosum]|uniref:type I restriction-modification system subunit M n=1 Tax=Marinobacterium arenosum TaxID=2862496 RepID=UPI001C972E7F|nr:class I SAM-dependent DNA methyltransferase [Marinobacterium arenosum]MBY4678892.1 type I restriction-modification system subunit M [Marinobacterium arenosum]
MENFSQTAAFIWSVADLLRGDFKQSQYGRVILPFTLLRRLECVLTADKKAVLDAHEKVKGMNLPEEAAEKMILRATSQKFFNTSPMTLSKLGESGIKDNLENYVQCFSRDAREIFEHFKFDEFVGLLSDANLLYKVVQKFANTDLSPERISNHEMGLVFEELIRRFAESSNETAGEHFTPRDIVHLTTSLVFMEDDEVLTKEGIIRTIYDPTAGTGGFLSSGMEYVLKMNSHAVIRAFGQELNPESYAICKADMLIKGQEVDRIKLGNTLSNDQLYADKFDYMLSNPPFGVDWKKVEKEIKDEHSLKGFDGRFGPGLPRVSDGSLLFLMHLLSKLRDCAPNSEGVLEGGARIGIILNGSPLFTGGAGSGESEIRRYILEADLLEAIVALPTDMFYNTGIATYIWVLSNKKPAERNGKVQLINGVNLSSKMRKSLGSKRKYLTEDDIRTLTREFGAFDEASAVDPTNQQPLTKIFNTTDFGYRRITIERPLRLSVQMDDERLATLRFAPKPFNAPMQWIWEQFGQKWDDSSEGESYGELAEFDKEVRVEIKASFPELKEKQIKDLLSRKLWRDQKALLDTAKALRAQLIEQMGEDAIFTGQCDDFNRFEDELKQALKATGIKLDAKQKKQLLDAISWKNPEAERVIKKVLKEAPQPKYGAFEVTVKGKPAVVEYQPDSELRDYENVPLDPTKRVEALIEEYFDREVAPHVPDAWIDANKRDDKDGEIGIVGYEIPFNRHFYVYQPPRSLEEIDADLDAVTKDIMGLLSEVHS